MTIIQSPQSTPKTNYFFATALANRKKTRNFVPTDSQAHVA